MFSFAYLLNQALIRANIHEVAKNITLEQGKTLVDAEGDVIRGLQVNWKRGRFASLSHLLRILMLMFINDKPKLKSFLIGNCSQKLISFLSTGIAGRGTRLLHHKSAIG